MTQRRLTPALAGSALLLIGASVAGGSQALIAHAASKTTASKKVTTPPPRPPGGGLMGTIMSVSGSTLKVKLLPTQKTVTVHLTTKTTYLVNGKSTKSHPMWKKGEQIQIMGTKAKNGSYTAASIVVGAPPAGPGGPPPGGTAPVSGTIVSSSSSSLEVKTSKGKSTFKLTSGTRYLVNGKATTSRPAFRAGQQVHVVASKSGSTLTAQMVFIGAMPAPPSGGPPPSFG